jgi:hypothetical protein
MEHTSTHNSFHRRYVERLNGIKLNLGRMSLLELQLLEEQCDEQFKDAHHELVVVRDVLETEVLRRPVGVPMSRIFD